MNYTLNPSLEYMTLLNVAVTLWDPRYIRDWVKKFCTALDSGELREQWLNITDIILAKAQQLPLPELLKEKTLVFVRAVDCQIVNWIDYHRVELHLNIGLPDEFCWTSQGLVDKKKTAEVLVKDEDIDITVRYQLACIYCLEGDIWELWDKIPEDRKQDFYRKDDPTSVSQLELVVLWTYDIKGEIAKMESMIERKLNRRCSPYLYAFLHAAEHGNRAAVEYFLQKLTSAERNEFFIRTATSVAISHHNEEFLKEYFSDILCVLLSQMEEEQQVEVFKKEPLCVLECFLDWPRQIFFMEMASRMWNFLPSYSYSVLLQVIIDKSRDGCKDFNYQELFREMWQQSPKTHKEYIFNHFIFNSLISALFKIRDENNIKLILQDTTCIRKKRFICSCDGELCCVNLIDSEEWGLLKFFIQECLSSKEEVITFKKRFRKWSLDVHFKSESRKMKLDKFFLLLDDIVGEFDKRKSVEEGHCEAKRPCNNF